MPETIRREAIRNRLLTALPPAELDGLLPFLEPVRLERGKVLHKPGDSLRRIHFIDKGLVALIKTMHDGRSAMVGTRGIEGLSLPSAQYPLGTIHVECVVQIPGAAHAIDAKQLQELTGGDSRLAAILRAYGSHVFEQLAQFAACNRLHSLEQRYAKILMTGYDNAGGDSLELTQESLAANLGVQRSRVSVVAGTFQRTGLIEYRHGRVRIVDPAAVKALACECYGHIRQSTDGLFERLAAGR